MFSTRALFSSLILQVWFLEMAHRPPILKINYKMYSKLTDSEYSILSTPLSYAYESGGTISLYKKNILVRNILVNNLSYRNYICTKNGERIIEIYSGVGHAKVPDFVTVDPFGIYFPTSIASYGADGTKMTIELGNSLSFYLLSTMVHEQKLKNLSKILRVDDSCLYVRRNYTTYKINSYTGKITNATAFWGKSNIKIRKI
jgi:hypothetical protein